MHDSRLLGHAPSQVALAEHQHAGSDRRLVVWAFFFDLVIEGLFLMPMGLFTYPGAIQSLSINAGTYYQWPVYEGLMWGGVQAGLCCLRYFTDDRGRTVVERDSTESKVASSSSNSSASWRSSPR